MLILTRKLGENIRIGDNIRIIVLDIKGGQVKLGIDAPPTVSVHREEIYERIREEMKERGLNPYKLRIVGFGVEVQRLKVQWTSELLETEAVERSRKRASKVRSRVKRTRTSAAEPAASRSGSEYPIRKG